MKTLTLKELESVIGKSDYAFLEDDRNIVLEGYTIEEYDVTLLFVSSLGEEYTFACNTSDLRIQADNNCITLIDEDPEGAETTCQFNVYTLAPLNP